jgi:hypothetical protein
LKPRGLQIGVQRIRLQRSAIGCCGRAAAGRDVSFAELRTRAGQCIVIAGFECLRSADAADQHGAQRKALKGSLQRH